MTKRIATSQDLLQNPDIARFMGVPAPMTQPVTMAPPSPEGIAPPAAQVPPPVEAAAAEEPAPTEEDAQTLYLKDLEKMGISKEKAAEIINDMLFKGAYEEDCPITKKLSIRLRTRDSRAADRLNAVINRENPQFTSLLYTLIANYNLAASLVRYGPHQFDPATEEGFEKTLNYIKTKIPLPVYQLMVTKLSKFDEKLSNIMRDGCVENFF